MSPSSRGARAFWARQDAPLRRQEADERLRAERERACHGLSPEEVERRGLIPPEAGPALDGNVAQEPVGIE